MLYADLDTGQQRVYNDELVAAGVLRNRSVHRVAD